MKRVELTFAKLQQLYWPYPNANRNHNRADATEHKLTCQVLALGMNPALAASALNHPCVEVLVAVAPAKRNCSRTNNTIVYLSSLSLL